MVTPAREAERYFTELWSRSRQAWVAGQVSAAIMKNGLPEPVDYVLTTVARLVDQEGAPIAKIEEVQARLRNITEGQFFYPPDSLHISLLGCTQRYPDRDVLVAERIEAVRRVCSQIINGRGAALMTLRGIGIIGNQAFVQILPYDRIWAQLRQELEDALIDIGESPITHPSKRPIHLNIMRIVDNEPGRVSDTLGMIEQLRDVDLGDVVFTNVAFMITDFVLSRANTEQLGMFQLAYSGLQRH